MEETAQDDENTIREEGEVKETLIAQMKQLETEVCHVYCFNSLKTRL